MFFTYVISPLIAFALYGKKIKSNLLLNIAKDTGVIPVILMFLFMIISALTIPIVFFVGKESVLVMFDQITRGSYSGKLFKKQQAEKADLHLHMPVQAHHHSIEITHHDHHDHHTEEEREHHDEEASIHRTSHVENLHEAPKVVHDLSEYIPNPKEYLNMKRIYFYLITVALWVIVTILSIIVGDVSVFFGVIGAIAGCFFMLTGPGLFYVIVTHKKKMGFPTTWSKVKYAFAWAYLWIGVFLTISLSM